MREHGFARQGVRTLKADLFSPGGKIFQQLKTVFVGPDLNEASRFEIYDLKDEPKPLGGAFGQAKALLLRFAEEKSPPLGSWVGLPRALFPRLSDGYYVCDLLGAEALDEKGQSFGQVVAFQDAAATLGGAVNLELESPGGKRFSFPAAWISTFKEGRLVVEGLSAWVDLRGRPDDT